MRNRVTGLRGTYRRATVLGRDFGYNQVLQQPRGVIVIVLQMSSTFVALESGLHWSPL